MHSNNGLIRRWKLGRTHPVQLVILEKTLLSTFSMRRVSGFCRTRCFRCWISEYQALPDLDASANTVLIQQITLENEGWERDVTVGEGADVRSARSQVEGV